MRIDSAVFYSNDIVRVVKFYVENFGLKVDNLEAHNYVELLFDGGARLAIKKAVEKREIPGKQTVFIAVDDVEAEYQKAIDSGLNIVKDLVDAGWAKVFTILDPDKNKVMIIKRPED
jgi:predicted enzyme related to lactoylglutathione lyase